MTVTELSWGEPDALVASGLGPDVAIEPGPPLQAVPPKIRLLTSAPDITAELEADGGGDHWVNGITFEPEAVR